MEMRHKGLLSQLGERMTVWTISVLLYGASVFIALTQSYREVKHSRRAHSAYVFAGYGCCFVWPLIAIAILLTQRSKSKVWADAR